MFEVEDIPNEDFVYVRVHRQNIDFTDLTIRPVAFDQKGDDGLSCNWSEYSTPISTQQMALKNPHNNGVISFEVGVLRAIPFVLEVVHNPVENPIPNQAHSLIRNMPPRKPNDLGFRSMLMDLFNWEIQLLPE